MAPPRPRIVAAVDGVADERLHALHECELVLDRVVQLAAMKLEAVLLVGGVRDRHERVGVLDALDGIQTELRNVEKMAAVAAVAPLVVALVHVVVEGLEAVRGLLAPDGPERLVETLAVNGGVRTDHDQDDHGVDWKEGGKAGRLEGWKKGAVLRFCVLGHPPSHPEFQTLLQLFSDRSFKKDR